jgi:hypothetical protein
MAVKFERVRQFATKHGRVDAFESPGRVAVLPNGNLDAIDYVEKATRFYFEGKSYTDEEFEKLIPESGVKNPSFRDREASVC